MTRRLLGLDRFAGLLIGLLLVAVGLLLVDWDLRRVLDLPPDLDLAPVEDVLAASWWPLVAAVACVLLVLVGLRWMIAHLPRISSPSTRLKDSSAAGRIELDTGSVARATAATLESELVLPDVSGRARLRRGRPVLELDARCSRHAEVAEMVERTDHVARDLVSAFPSGAVGLRVVVDGPRPRRRTPGRRANVRVE